MADILTPEQEERHEGEVFEQDFGSGGDGGFSTEAPIDTMEAQLELISLAEAFEQREEAKVRGDGHEMVSGGSMTADPLDQESDELVDGQGGQGGSEGSMEEMAEGVYTETREVSNGARAPEEVQGFDPIITRSELITPPPRDLITTEMAMEQAPELSQLLEIVHGADDRRRVYNTTGYPWRTICKLEIIARDGTTWRCSGAFIGPRTVLTNGHCVYMHDRGGWVRQVRVLPGKNGASNPFGTGVSTFYHSVRGWTRSRSSNYDYAVVVLPSNRKLGNTVGWMGLANLSFFSLLGLRVNNAGYPGDKPGNFQWWNANNILAVTSRRVYYRIDTFGGQSGSPVWRYKNQKRHIVAVHNTGGNPFNGAVRLVKPVFDNLVKWKNQYK